MTSKDLGLVTAYAYAVSQGYTGTEEEFAELMASYATVAEEAAESAAEAAVSATAAGASETNAASSAASANQSATSAGNSATSASGSAVQAQASATAAGQSATQAAGSATAAGNSATAAAGSATQAAASETAAGASATAAAGSATSASGSATAAAGSATEADASADRAQEILDSIPEDYSELSEDVANLSSAIGNVSEGYADLPIVRNEYVKSNGDFASYTGWFRTSKIEIPNNAKWILIYIPANTNYSAWYDSNGTFKSTLNLVGGAGWKRVAIPAGVKYFALSNDEQYIGQYLYCGNEKMTELFNFLLSDFVINTTQTVTFDSSGRPTSILFKRDGVTIREDTFEYSGNVITEYRTDSATGYYVTINTNLTTLETGVQ
jgi:hypothetical protein